MIVPRLEAEPAYQLNGKEWTFDLGYTSLYTVFEGNLGKYFSFSFSNHWFTYTSSFEDTKALYTNTWRADALNWCDWANVSLHLGGFALTLGKDYLHLGTFENDAYDFDSHWQINTMLWNNYQVYQWGGSLNWTSNDEAAHVMFQMTSDQSMEKPFGSRYLRDYAYNLFGSYEFESVTLMASVGHFCIGWMGSLGVQGQLSDALSLTGDAYFSKDYYAGTLKLAAELGDHFDLFAKVGYDYGRTEWILEGKGFTGGLGAYWYPLRNSKDMRVHALFNYDGINRVMNMSAGITYALNLKLF